MDQEHRKKCSPSTKKSSPTRLDLLKQLRDWLPEVLTRQQTDWLRLAAYSNEIMTRIRDRVKYKVSFPWWEPENRDSQRKQITIDPMPDIFWCKVSDGYKCPPAKGGPIFQACAEIIQEAIDMDNARYRVEPLEVVMEEARTSVRTPSRTFLRVIWSDCWEI